MHFTDEQVAAFDRALTGPLGEDVIRMASDLVLREPGGPYAPEVIQAGLDSGLLSAPGALSPAGTLVADSCRELLLWRKRGRVVHYWHKGPMLPETFEGKTLLSLGCGVGVNLFHLQNVAKKVYGQEVQPAYVAMTPTFAKIEGVPAPDVRVGPGESVDLPDASVDVIIVLGALQYMDFPRAFAECSRLLAPGGTAIFGLGDLPRYIRSAYQFHTSAWRGVREGLRELVAIGAMALYPWTNRRFRPGDVVFPVQSYVRREIERAGMRFDASRSGQIADFEGFYVAIKP